MAYAKILKEKDKLVSHENNILMDWCDLCDKVHVDTKTKIIPDIKAWSHYEGVCSVPTDSNEDY